MCSPLTPAPPAYAHGFWPSNSLSAFDGQNASGIWTLVVCAAVGGGTGQFRSADLYITSTNLTVAKSSSVISDSVSGANPKAAPGAVIHYCIFVTNTGTVGTAASTNVVASDVLPANMTYLISSLSSGTTCAGAATPEDDDAAGADERDPFGVSIGGSTISGSAATLPAGEDFAMVFRATVN